MSSTSLILALVLFISTANLSNQVPIVKRDTAQTITYEKFLGIQLYWTRDQITAYMDNDPGVVTLEVGSGSFSMQTIQYTTTNSMGLIRLDLTNNILNTKSQAGLNENRYLITLAQYNQITIGMTRQRVTSLIGNEGQISAEATSQIITYGYNEDTSILSVPSVQITFSMGVVAVKNRIGI